MQCVFCFKFKLRCLLWILRKRLRLFGLVFFAVDMFCIIFCLSIAGALMPKQKKMPGAYLQIELNDQLRSLLWRISLKCDNEAYTRIAIRGIKLVALAEGFTIDSPLVAGDVPALGEAERYEDLSDDEI